jgi:ribosomal protein S27E
MMKQMSYKEFRETYMGKKSKWDFSLFTIKCNKCGSAKVEFNGYTEVGSGYYSGEYETEGSIVIKCHNCGNAQCIGSRDIFNEELNTDGEVRARKIYREIYDKRKGL